MLVLTRKLMERLYIGDDICVTVVRLEGGQVRLGIDAPRHVRVVRAELDRFPAARTHPAAPTRPAASMGERTPPTRSQATQRSPRGSSRTGRGPFPGPQSPGA